MEEVLATAPRAVRIIELSDRGEPIHTGLFIVEVGTRLVFTMKPNAKVDLVSEFDWLCGVYSRACEPRGCPDQPYRHPLL